MTGFIRFSWGYEIPTRPEIWESAKSEEEYFLTLAKLNKKVKPGIYVENQIPDSEPGIVPGGL